VTRDAADVVIVGGGVMGCSTAWHLATLSGGSLSITIVERDPSYRKASSALSLSSIRQQFTTPVSIAMSRYTLSLLRDSSPLAVGGAPAPDLDFVERGYLFLGRGRDVGSLEKAWAMQQSLGVSVELVRDADLSRRFPWLASADLAIASLGLRDEGWFDGYSLLRSLRAAAREAGAIFVEDEAVAVHDADGGGFDLMLRSGARLSCSHLVNAAGPWAAGIAEMAGVPLPVRAQKRCVFVVDAPDADSSWPLVIDPDGFYFRPEGTNFLVGAPAPQEFHGAEDFAVDHDVFESLLWPALAARAPAFERLKLRSAWAGHYEMNILDGNAIIGAHPGRSNFWLINGFSGHGMQHAPAAGRGLAELIWCGGFRTIDLTSLGYARLIEGGGQGREAHII
jgi:glycine/D-amino acid oxidase-like deaminating enzyme